MAFHLHTSFKLHTSARKKPLPRSTILLVNDDALESHVRADALARHFGKIQRASDATDAIILLNEREFAETVALVIVGLHRPGLSGPAFLEELAARLPEVPIVVTGQPSESARDYSLGEFVKFLPRGSSTSRILAEVRACLGRRLRKAA